MTTKIGPYIVQIDGYATAVLRPDGSPAIGHTDLVPLARAAARAQANADRLADLLEQCPGFFLGHGYACVLTDKIKAALATHKETAL
jgi:hypothetical protein